MDDARRWKALATISGSHEGETLIEHLLEVREELRNALEKVTNHDELCRLQGRADILTRLVNDLRQARDVVHQRYSN